MTVASLITGISPGDLTKYPRKVSDMLAVLINEHGVRYRMIDGSHLLLYSGDRSTRPFKVAAGRPEEAAMRYLNGWVDKHLPEVAGVLRPIEDVPLPDDIDTNDNGSDNDMPKHNAPTRQWVIFNAGKDDERVSAHIYKEGDHYYCTCGEWDKATLIGAHKHEGKHTGAAQEASAKSAATRIVTNRQRALEAEQEETMVREAVVLLARHHGVTINEEAVSRLTTENEALKAKVADLETKLALVREATAL